MTATATQKYVGQSVLRREDAALTTGRGTFVDDIRVVMARADGLDWSPDAARELLSDYLDVLIDGRFIEEEKDATLQWRGSRNQIIWQLR